MSGDEIRLDDLPSNDDEPEKVDLRPGPGSDTAEEIERFVPADLRALFEVYSYRHAAAILAGGFTDQFAELCNALLRVRITTRHIQLPGGNESEIPKLFSSQLRPHGWYETRIRGDLNIVREIHTPTHRTNRKGAVVNQIEIVRDQIVRSNFLDGHKVDYVKGSVAFDLEWNSKDQTFDRDLYALRAFHECGLISVGVLVTRSRSLNPMLDLLPALKKNGEVELFEDGKKKGQPRPCSTKMGDSTTWMGKLLYRLNTGRLGGCPVLVLGITPTLISDWTTHELNPDRVK